MELSLNYQQIIDMMVKLISCSLPIGLIFGITEKLVNMFLSFAFGKEKINI